MKKTRDEKAVVENFYGKKFPRDMWKDMKPEEDETISDVAKGLPPRIVEREFEFAGAFGAYKNVAGVAEAEEIKKLVRFIRMDIFGSPERPFGSAQDAVDWIEAQHLTWDRCFPTEEEE